MQPRRTDRPAALSRSELLSSAIVIYIFFFKSKGKKKRGNKTKTLIRHLSLSLCDSVLLDISFFLFICPLFLI